MFVRFYRNKGEKNKMPKKFLSVNLILSALLFGAAQTVSAQTVSAQTTSAESAAKSFVAAWKNGSRAQARKFASAAAVAEIFKTNGKNAGWQSISCGKRKTGVNCSFYYEGGAANMRVVKKGAAFQVSSISFLAD